MVPHVSQAEDAHHARTRKRCQEDEKEVLSGRLKSKFRPTRPCSRTCPANDFIVGACHWTHFSPAKRVILPQNFGLFLTHGELCPRNIIVNNGSVKVTLGETARANIPSGGNTSSSSWPARSHKIRTGMSMPKTSSRELIRRSCPRTRK